MPVFRRFVVFAVVLCCSAVYLFAQNTAIRAAATTATLQPVWKNLTGTSVYQFSTAATRVGNILRTGVFAATTKGLYRSLDSGRTWNVIGVPNDDVYDVAILGTDGLSLLAASNKGVQRSINGGTSWQVMTFPLTVVTTSANANSTRATVQYITQQRALPTYALQTLKSGNTTILFAGTSQGIFRSTDNGTTWSSTGTVSSAVMAQKTVRTLVLLGDILYAAVWNDGIYQSPDKGITWTTVDVIPGSSAEKTFRVLSVYGSTIYAGSSEGNLYQSQNGRAWTKIAVAGNNGRSGIDARGVEALAQHENVVIGAVYNGIVASDDHGRTWQRLNLAVNDVVALVLFGGERVTKRLSTQTVATASKGGSETTAQRDTVITQPMRLLTASANDVSAFDVPPPPPTSPSTLINHYCSFEENPPIYYPSVLYTAALTPTAQKTITLTPQLQDIYLFDSFWIDSARFRTASGNPAARFEVSYNGGSFTTVTSGFTGIVGTTYISQNGFVRAYELYKCSFSLSQKPAWFQGYGTYQIRSVLVVDNGTEFRRESIGTSILNLIIGNPVPTISSISPTSAVRGGGSVAATVTGTNFVPESQVILTSTSGRIPARTTYVSPTQLNTFWESAALLPSLAVDSYAVTVENPTPGGGASLQSQTLTIVNPAPTAGGLSIAQINAGTSSPLVISGTGYYDGSQVYFDGQLKPSTFSNGNLTINLIGSDIPTARTYSVVVVNPAPGGGSTQPMSLNVVNPTPSITAFTPSPLGLGEDATLNLSGGGSFVSGAVAILYPSGTELTTTFVNTNTLTVSVPGSLLATVSETNYSIRVRNPAPGGGLSAPVTVPVRNGAPSLSGVSPNSLVAAAQDTPLTLTGGNFLSGATALISGPGIGLNTPLTTTVVNANTITATLPAGIATSVGQYSLIVRNPNSVADSPTQNINIVYPQAQLSSVTPSPIPAQNAAQTLTLSGTNFVSGAQVRIQDEATNGQTVNQLLSASVINSSQINATLPQTLAERVGRYRLTVDNPSPNAGVSGTVNVDVLALTPTFAALSTTSATMTGAAQTLTLTGTNFVSTAQNGTIVEVNGQPVTASVLSGTQISLTLPVTLLDSARVLTIRIVNPALTINGTPQGGGASVTRTFTLLYPAPALSGVAPQVVTANPVSSTPVALTLTGTNFTASSRVLVQRTGTTTVDTLQATPNNLVGGLATSLALTLPAPLFTDATTFTLRVLTPYGSIPAGFVSGGVSAPQTLTVQNPLPAITNLTPAQSLILQTTTVTITGTNFVQPSAVNNNRGTVAYFGATALPTSVLSPTSVQVTIASALLTVAQNYSITVRNPLVNGLGGGTSNAATFTALNPTALLDSIVVPNGSLPLVVSSATRTVSVFGQFFVNGVSITLSRTGGNAVAPQTLSTTFVSSTHVTLSIPTAFLAEAGTLSFQAANPNPTGGASNTLSVAIVNPRPRLFTLTPTIATISASDIALTLDGGNFLPNSTIVVRGTTQGGADTTITLAPTGYTPANATPTRLTVSVPTTFAALAGTYFVWVQNPTPSVNGNTNSDTLSLFMRNPLPTLASVTPATVSTGSGDTTVTLVGTNFTPLSSVLLNGTALATNRIVIQDRTTILATIPAALMTQATTLNVQVTIPAPGGGTSVVRTLTVRNAAPVLDSIAPATIAAMRDTVITAYGSGFNLTSQFRLIRGTTTVTLAIVSLPSSAVARLSIPAAAIVTLATYQVRVFNAAPGGGTSVVRNLVVQGGLAVSMEFLNVTTSIVAGASLNAIAPGVQVRFRDALGILSDVTADSLYATRLPDAALQDTVRKGLRLTRLSAGLYSVPSTVFTTAGTFTLALETQQMAAMTTLIGNRSFAVRPTVRANVWIEFFNAADSAITSLTATTSLAKTRLTYRDRFQNLTDSTVGIVRLLTVAGNPWGASTATLDMQRTSLGLYNLAAPLQITTAGTYYLNPAGLSRAVVLTTAMDSLVVAPAAPTAYIRSLRSLVNAGTSQPAFTVIVRDAGSNRVDLVTPRLTYTQLDTLPTGEHVTGEWALTRTALGTYTAPVQLFTVGGLYSFQMTDGLTPVPVSASGLTPDTVFTVLSSVATRLAIADADTTVSPLLPDTLRAGGVMPRLRFAFRDASGNLTDNGVTLTSATYRVAVGASSGTLRLERESVGLYWTSSTFASVFVTAGTYTITVRGIQIDSIMTNGIQPGRRTFVVTPQPASSVLFTGLLPTLTSGAAQARFRATLRDTFNNLTDNVQTGSVTALPLTQVWYSMSTDATVSDSTRQANAGLFTMQRTSLGVFLADAHAPITEAGNYAIGIQGITSTTGTAAFTVRPNVDYRIVFENVPDTLTAGDSLHNVIVRYFDINDNPTDNSLGRILYTRTGGSSTATIQNTRIGTGVYALTTTQATLAGTYTLSVSGIANVNYQGNRVFVLRPAPAASVQFTSVTPVITAGGNQAAFRLQLRDRFGNATSDPGAVAVDSVRYTNVTTGSIGVSSGTIAIAPIGVGLFSAAVTRFNTSGNYTLALNGTINSIGTMNFTVNPAAVRTVNIAGVPSSIIIGTTLPTLTLTFRDLYGNYTDAPNALNFSKSGTPTSTGTLTLARAALGVTSATSDAFVVAGNYTLAVSGISAANTNGRTTFTVLSSAPQPTFSAMTPTTATATSGTIRLTVSGSNFVPTSVIQLSSTTLSTVIIPTQFIDGNTLSADVSISIADEYLLSVYTPTPGGGISATQTLSILPAKAAQVEFAYDKAKPYSSGDTVNVTMKVTDEFNNLTDYTGAFEYRTQSSSSASYTTKKGAGLYEATLFIGELAGTYTMSLQGGVTSKGSAELTAEPIMLVFGTTQDANGILIPGAQVTAKRNGTIITTAISSARGTYSLRLSRDTYDITGTKTGYTFTPISSLAVNRSILNQILIANAYSISGKISNAANQGVPGVTVTISGNGLTLTAVSDVNGNYIINSVPAQNTYSITAALANYTITPTPPNTGSVQMIQANVNNVNFTAPLQIIRGTVYTVGNGTLPGATVELTGASLTQPLTTETNDLGQYAFGVAPGTYTVTPKLSDGCTAPYTPANRTLALATQPLSGIDFISPATWKQIGNGLKGKWYQAFASEGANLYTANYNNRTLFHSTNNGDSWTQIPLTGDHGSIYRMRLSQGNLWGTAHFLFPNIIPTSVVTKGMYRLENGEWKNVAQGLLDAEIHEIETIYDEICIQGPRLPLQLVYIKDPSTWISSPGGQTGLIGFAKKEFILNSQPATIMSYLRSPSVTSFPISGGIFLGTGVYPPNAYFVTNYLNNQLAGIGAYQLSSTGLNLMATEKFLSVCTPGPSININYTPGRITLRGPRTPDNEVVLGNNNLIGTSEGIYQFVQDQVSLTSYGSWARRAANIIQGEVLSIVSKNNTVFAVVRNKGVFRSDDAGTTWSEFNCGLTDKTTQNLQIHGNYVIVGTFEKEGGVYRALISPAATSPTISGRVTNASGTNIAGVQIEIRNNNGALIGTTFTDNNGQYWFLNIPTGAYTLVPSLTGYTFTPQPAAITLENTDVVQNFTAIPPASISGTVREGANPLTGVTVTLLNDNGQPVGSPVITGADGTYTFTNIIAGTYSVTATLQCYRFSTTVTMPLTVAGSNINNVDFIGTATPNVAINPTGSIIFPGNITVGQNSSIQSYIVSASCLTGPLNISSANPAFQISRTETPFTPEAIISLTPVDGVVIPTTIYVRFTASVADEVISEILHESQNTVIIRLSVAARGIDPCTLAGQQTWSRMDKINNDYVSEISIVDNKILAETASLSDFRRSYSSDGISWIDLPAIPDDFQQRKIEYFESQIISFQNDYYLAPRYFAGSIGPNTPLPLPVFSNTTNQWRKSYLPIAQSNFRTTIETIAQQGNEVLYICGNSETEAVILRSTNGIQYEKIHSAPSIAGLHLRMEILTEHSSVLANMRQSGVFYSTNKGSAWQKISTTLPGGIANTIALNNGIVWAGTDNGIFQWNEMQNTWQQIALANENVTALFVRGQTIWAATKSSVPFIVKVSTDNGTNWLSYPSSPQSVFDDRAIKFFFPNNSSLPVVKVTSKFLSPTLSLVGQTYLMLLKEAPPTQKPRICGTVTSATPLVLTLLRNGTTVETKTVSGAYCFDCLDVGTYSITAAFSGTPPAGSVITPAQYNNIAVSTSDINNQDFTTSIQLSSVGGSVNNITASIGIQGVPVSITYGNTTLQTVTDQNGNYSFANIPGGTTFTVTVGLASLPAGCFSLIGPASRNGTTFAGSNSVVSYAFNQAQPTVTLTDVNGTLSAVDFGSVPVNTTPIRVVKVSGSCLAGPLTLVAPNGFQISLSNSPFTPAANNTLVFQPNSSLAVMEQSVYLRYQPICARNSQGDLQLSSPDPSTSAASPTIGKLLTTRGSGIPADPCNDWTLLGPDAFVSPTNPNAYASVYSMAISGTKLFMGSVGGGVGPGSKNGLYVYDLAASNPAWVHQPIIVTNPVNPMYDTYTGISSIVTNSAGDIFISFFYDGTQNKLNGVYRSTDGGNTWEYLAQAPIKASTLYIDNNGVIFAGAEDAFAFSKTNGSTWIYPASALLQSKNITGIATTVINGQETIFVGSGPRFNGSSLVADGSGLYVSDDGGMTWQQKYMGNPQQSQRITTLAANANRLFVSTIQLYPNGTFITEGIRYSDDGITFINATGTAIGDVTNPILTIGTTIFAGQVTSIVNPQRSGIYRSNDNGVTWQKISSNCLYNTAPQSFTHYTQNNKTYLLFGTAWGANLGEESGVYKIEVCSPTMLAKANETSSLTSSLSSAQAGNPPSQITAPPLAANEGLSKTPLISVQPNPTSGNADIIVSLPNDEYISLALVDMLGREVAQVGNGIYKRGKYTIPFHAEFLASGQYICVLKTSTQRVHSLVHIIH